MLRRTSDEGRRTIVFLHGWASGPYVWLHQASFFKDRYNVHTPQLVGEGKDISDFITKNKLDNICLVGWSLGGIVSLKLAAQLKNRVSHLVLIGTTPRFVQSDDFKYGVSREVIEKIYNRMKADFQGTLEWFYKFCFSSNERSRNEFGEIMKLLGEFIPPFDVDKLLAGLKLLMELDVRDLLSRIAVPALIIQGSQDRVCLPEAGEFLAKRLKNASFSIIDNAGHAPFLTQPEKVNRLIEKFISR